jgi:hypothetical protein
VGESRAAMPLVVARRVIGRVESIAFLPPPVAKTGELCRIRRLDARVGCCVTGTDCDSVQLAGKGVAGRFEVAGMSGVVPGVDA